MKIPYSWKRFTIAWREQYVRTYLERDIPQLGISETAIRHYIEILQDTFMVRLLMPWHENISKR